MSTPVNRIYCPILMLYTTSLKRKGAAYPMEIIFKRLSQLTTRLSKREALFYGLLITRSCERPDTDFLSHFVVQICC